MSHIVACLKVTALLLFVLLTKAHATVIETKLSNQKTVQIAVTDIPYSFSPYGTDGLDAQYSHLFFDPLIRWGQDRKLEYRLLDKLKVINENKTRFYLKKDIHFHSGNLLTSNDVIWSFKEAKRNKHHLQKLQNIVKIKRINNYQFDIETKLTQAQLLDYLSHLYILDSDYYKKYKIDHNVAQAALAPPITMLPLSGTGPYRVDSFYAGINLRVQVNSDYWQPLPTINSLNFVKIKSIDSRLYALLADDIDISETISTNNINSVRQLDNKKIYQVESLNTLFLIINETKNKLFEREVARNAIHLAINQAGMLKHILHGMGSIDSSLKIVASEIDPPIYDTKRAKYILSKIDAPSQLSLLVMNDKNAHTKEVVAAFKNMLKKVDIQLLITEVNTVEDWNDLQFDYDLSISYWQSPLINSENIYQDIFYNSLFSPYLEMLFKQENKPLTMQHKIKLFKEYKISDRIVPLFSQEKIWATDKQFNLENVFSINAIPYWHQLTITQ